MATTIDQLGKQAKDVTEDLRKMGATVRDAAQEKLGQVGEKVSECCEQGRDKVHGVACACEQFLRKRPLTSVFLAAGVGLVVGRFWPSREKTSP